MVGISDGNNDGRFKIQRGQGISQAIATELGLNAQQCRKLGSVWNEIFKEVDKQNEQTKIYSGGNDLHGPTNRNYVVHTNQIVGFSKEIWNKIVQLVNAKLGTNIQATEGSAPAAGNDAPPAEQPPASPERTAPPARRNNPPTNDRPPAPVKVSTEGIAPDIPSEPYLAETPDVSAAVTKLKGETQSNWAVSSKMKSALKTVTKENVAYFIKEYNEDGSDIVGDIDGCMNWNKKDIYEHLTKKLAARAKELGIDISGYDITPKTVQSVRAVGSAGVTQQVATTQYPSLEAQRKFLKEISARIVSDESLYGEDKRFLQTYKPQIEKANATIKKFADAPVENIRLQEKNQYEYTLLLNDKSALSIKTDANNKIISLQIKNSSSPDNIGDLRYNFEGGYISLDPDEKYSGKDDVKKSGYLNYGPIPFDELKKVAVNLLRKMGVEVSAE